MSFEKNNGRPKQNESVETPQRRTFERHPYWRVVLIVAAAAGGVSVVDWFFGFAPLILLGGAAVISYKMAGARAGMVAALLAGVVSDYFFVDPILTFTRNSLILSAGYTAAALLSGYVKRSMVWM